MTSRVLSWLTASAPMPRWFICVAVLAMLVVAAELAVWLTLWLEQRKFDRENRD